METNPAYFLQSKAFALLATLLFSLYCTGLHAIEYGHYDLKRLAQQNAPPAKGATLDMVYLDNLLTDLRQHAGNYPPRFDSPADAQRAQRDATTLMGMLGAAFSSGQTSPDMLLRMGVLGARY